jgi:hypothetical protein
VDKLNGTPGQPRGETATNRADRIRTTDPRHPGPEFDPNSKLGETPANRVDRLRETDVHGLTLKHFIERKTDRY